MAIEGCRQRAIRQDRGDPGLNREARYLGLSVPARMSETDSAHIIMVTHGRKHTGHGDETDICTDCRYGRTLIMPPPHTCRPEPSP